MKPLYKKITVAAVSLALCATYLLVANKAIGVNKIDIADKEIPDSFNNFRIAHISDLHNESFGKDNEKLLSEIEELTPDVIVITGDIVDSYRTDAAVAEAFVSQAVKIAPVYYVTGNHEFRTGLAERLTASFESCGAKALCGKKLTLEKEGSAISFYGVDDPRASGDYLTEYEAEVIADSLEKLDKGEGYSVLLSHRPEFFDMYSQYGFDLVLTGHAHGGQFRIPFIGGVFAPGQGFFPEYDSGAYEKDGTTMVVSRGLGNSVIPLRVNNNPELILITLKKGVQ